MFRLAVPFCILLFLTIATGQSLSASEPAKQWQLYVLPDEELSFSLPEEPMASVTYRPQKNPNDPNEKPKSGRLYSAYGAGVVYLIVSFDNPLGAESLEAFEAEADSLPAGGHGLKLMGDLSLAGFPGREYSFNSILSGFVRFYQGKNHVYVVQAITDEINRTDLELFFDSLSFASRKPNYDPAQHRQAEMVNSSPAPAAAATENGVGPGKSGSVGSVAPGRGEGVGPGVSGGIGTGTGGGVGPGEGSGMIKSNGVGTGPTVASTAGPTVFTGKDVTRKARIVFKPAAGYTTTARRNQITGTVVLRAVLASSGHVERIVALKPLPDGLTERAILAARTMRFIPAVKDGQWVSQYIQIEYAFNLY
jgi:TonB family protein